MSEIIYFPKLETQEERAYRLWAAAADMAQLVGVDRVEEVFGIVDKHDQAIQDNLPDGIITPEDLLKAALIDGIRDKAIAILVEEVHVPN